MTTVTCCHTIVPSEDTPNVRWRLSEIDQMQPLKHTLSVYVYKPNPDIATTTPPIQAMIDSLSKILVYYYPLAGRLHWAQSTHDRLELHCNAMGVKLFEAESQAKLADYADFETDAVRDLVPKFDYENSPIEEWPLLLVQLTRLSCGGFCVGVASSHVALDGWAAIQFVKLWGKMARGQSLDPQEIPFHDRIFLKPSEPRVPPRYDHSEYKKPPPVLGCVDSKEEQKKETRVAMLKLTSDQVLKLKNKANEGLQTASARPYSRYEAIAAHVWRCACRARQGNEAHQPTVVRMMSDIRNRWKPPIPLNYSGNTVLLTLTPVSTYEEIMGNPLSYGAQKIRDGVQTLTNDYCRSSLDFVASQEKVDWLRIGSVGSNFYGNPNMSIVSWINLPVYDTDFGWGKPLRMVPVMRDGDGKSFIMPTPDGDGSLILALRLQTLHMEAFKKFFYQDI
ncbi:hypothetical protein L6164_004809 [Bauhinia variegata]|uniref:Uncharacterized protein n=1 Tax=Bauhinia variegata TaxID=167791 RepID=A0ACB9PUT4_BAUVA|nr:hypothetical protein L6164_004809 [Bauhinia variegata]